MSEQFLGEIRIFSIPYAPQGWSLCDGQTLAITQNEALFALLGTTYGGNGTSTFQLPNLQGRVPLHMGEDAANALTYVQGQTGGEEAHLLSALEMPIHSHTINAVQEPATSPVPTGRVLGAAGAGDPCYENGTANAALHPSTIGTIGANTSHENRQPFLALNFCIALSGIFPSRN